MNKIILFFLTLAVTCTVAADEDRIKIATMPQGITVVVSEGELEPRSAGSYSLKLYARNDPAFPYDRFMTGLVRPRNGTLEAIKFADLNHDGTAEIIVITRYTGSGAFVTADAFRAQRDSVKLLASIAELDAKNDAVEALKKKLKSLN